MWFLFEPNIEEHVRGGKGERLSEAEAEVEESVESKQENSTDTSITAAGRGEGGREVERSMTRLSVLGSLKREPVLVCVCVGVCVMCPHWRWQQKGQRKPTVKCRQQQQQQ